MAETEAEALLRSGALYPIRVGLIGGEQPIFVGLKHGACSIYLGDEPSVHVDLEGRWQRAYIAPSHHLRRLDGTTQAIARPRFGGSMELRRRTLDRDEAARLDESIRMMATDLADRVDLGTLRIIEPPPPARPIAIEDLRSLLGRIASWDRDAWNAYRSTYRRVYGPPPFVPPESQGALVLEATTGPDDIRRPPDAFHDHCQAVADLLGDGLIPARNLLLAGESALRAPVEVVEATLRIATAVFPLAEGPLPRRRSEWPVHLPRRDGVHAVLARFDPPLPGPLDWSRLRPLGLSRVTLLIGQDRDLQGDPAAVVAGMKRAGIAVGVVAVFHAGMEPGRLVDTVAGLGLERGDHVSLMDHRERDGSERPGDTGDPPIDAIVDAIRTRLTTSAGPGLLVRPYSASKQGF